MGQDAQMATEEPPLPNPSSGDETRSQLAAERTLLAWWRSGLAALAVSLGVGRLAPAVLQVPTLPFVLLGIGFGALSLAFTVYGTIRQRHVDRAIPDGSFRSVDRSVVLALTAAMCVLAVATIALVFSAR